MCGGTAICSNVKPYVSGLSPRVRGNRTLMPKSRRCWRSIPACAGEPEVVAVTTPMGQVYPRVYGGTATCLNGMIAACGLSPRVRGNPPRPAKPCRAIRSIPACAGEPSGSPSTIGVGGVYPRVCGGTLAELPNCHLLSGLSPRVRGNRQLRCAFVCRKGSIPACAGEPQGGGDGVDDLKVYPACAGEPRRHGIRRCGLSVYPRVCGGTAQRLTAMWLPEGLSPRVRGNRQHLTIPCLNQRSIPACAGEPQAECRRSGRQRVYPRVCGGTLRVSGLAHCCLGLSRVCGGTQYIDEELVSAQGLSPRVRGNHRGYPLPAF